MLSLSQLVLHLALVKTRGGESERAELECVAFFHICQPTDAAAAPTAQLYAVSQPLDEILFIIARQLVSQGHAHGSRGARARHVLVSFPNFIVNWEQDKIFN